VIVFLIIGPVLLGRIGTRGAAALAAAAGIIRWSVAGVTTSVWLLSVLQPLHGLTFALLHLACMRMMASLVPISLCATAQGLYAFAAGLASSALTLLSGILYASYGGHSACVCNRTTIAESARKYNCRATRSRHHSRLQTAAVVCLPELKGTLFGWRTGMLRREFITLLGGAATAWPLGVQAQKMPVIIGFLGGQAQAAPGDPQGRALRQGFLDHGLVEGRDYVMEERFAGGDNARIVEFANELARSKVRMILTNTPAGVRAAQRLDPPVPVLMTVMHCFPRSRADARMRFRSSAIPRSAM
jgi:MFS family permease